MQSHITQRIIYSLALCCFLLGSFGSVVGKNPTNKEVVDGISSTIDKAIKDSKLPLIASLGVEGGKLGLRSALYYQMSKSKDASTIKTYATLNAVADMATIILKTFLMGWGGVMTTLPNFIDMFNSLKAAKGAKIIAKNNSLDNERDLDTSLLLLLFGEKGLYLTSRGLELNNKGKGVFMKLLKKNLNDPKGGAYDPDKDSGIDEYVFSIMKFFIDKGVRVGMRMPSNIAMRLMSFSLFLARQHYERKYINSLLQKPDPEEIDVDID